MSILVSKSDNNGYQEMATSDTVSRVILTTYVILCHLVPTRSEVCHLTVFEMAMNARPSSVSRTSELDVGVQGSDFMLSAAVVCGHDYL